MWLKIQPHYEWRLVNAALTIFIMVILNCLIVYMHANNNFDVLGHLLLFLGIAVYIYNVHDVNVHVSQSS